MQKGKASVVHRRSHNTCSSQLYRACWKAQRPLPVTSETGSLGHCLSSPRKWRATFSQRPLIRDQCQWSNLIIASLISQARALATLFRDSQRSTRSLCLVHRPSRLPSQTWNHPYHCLPRRLKRDRHAERNYWSFSRSRTPTFFSSSNSDKNQARSLEPPAQRNQWEIFWHCTKFRRVISQRIHSKLQHLTTSIPHSPLQLTACSQVPQSLLSVLRNRTPGSSCQLSSICSLTLKNQPNLLPWEILKLQAQLAWVRALVGGKAKTMRNWRVKSRS